MRRSRSDGPDPAASRACRLVGVGASAGGLEAFRRFFSALPPDSGFTFIVVQHLDPSHPSRLPELLAKDSPLPVLRANDGTSPAPGTVYVVPEGRVAFMKSGKLRTRRRIEGQFEQPIDELLNSLARDSRGACGVLLSGQGSDGLLGLREISGSAGVTFVQSPDSAAFGSLPRAVIDAGLADFVGTPEELAASLTAVAGHPAFEDATRETATLSEDEERGLEEILLFLCKQKDFDFTCYKRATVRRRVRRRAMLRGAESMAEYLSLLSQERAEADALVSDMLINVTQFFRDPEVFTVLRERVFPALIERKDPTEPIRMWVVGCSTGEEVYSLLITLLEVLDGAERRSVTIFGTDASEAAVKAARAGVYPADICASVSKERLKRYFHSVDGGYEVDKSLREMCVFARQDITKDTPFSRIDLVSMRNVLIYMERELQEKVLAVAHYALLPDGILLLGTSETTDAQPRLFAAFDKRHHVYTRRNVAAHLPLTPGGPSRFTLEEISLTAQPETVDFDIVANVDKATLDAFAPARVVIDADRHVVHFFGDTGPYLELGEGRATFDVSELARPGLELDLRDALDASERSRASAERVAMFTDEGVRRNVRLVVAPMDSPPGQSYRLVAFSDVDTSAPLPSTQPEEDLVALYEGREERLRRELTSLRTRLRAVSDEKGRSNLALSAANEEVRSSNEELQSINEELETAKEELQSANEELITVNDELNQRNRDLVSVNDDLYNYIASTEIPLVMLDCELRVRRFTPEAEQVVHLTSADEGRRIDHLKMRVDIPDLCEVLTGVIEHLETVHREVQDEAGRWYSMQVRPYRSSANRIEGLVVAFIDIHELKENIGRVERRAALADSLARIDAAIASTLDFDGIMQSALDEGAAAVRADAGAIQLRDGDAWVVRYEYGFGPDDLGLRLTDEKAPVAARAAQTRAPVLVPDTAAQPEYDVGFTKAKRLKSLLGVPLVAREQVVGILLFSHTEQATRFTRPEVDFAARLGASVSLAMENARLFEAETHATRTAETLSKINEILLSALTLDDVLERLIGEASVAAGADKCLVVAIDGETFTVTHLRNVREDLVGVAKTAKDYPGFALAARERRPILIDDNWSDPRTNKEFVVPYELRAFQLLPLTVDDEIGWVLALGYDHPQHFDDEDYRTAERMADAMSVALSNARLYEAEQVARADAIDRAERIAMLGEFAELALASLDSREIATRFAKLARERLGADMANVVVAEQEAGVLRIIGQAGIQSGVQPESVPIDSDTQAATTFRGGKTVFIEDIPLSEDVSQTTKDGADRLQARAVVQLPLKAHGEVVGLASFVFGTPQSFPKERVAFFESVAAHMAVGLQNARLFEAEQEARAEVERTAAALSESEKAVRGKLEALLSPEGDIGELRLSEILDVPAVQSLMEEFYQTTHIPMALIDLDGEVPVGVGWQDVCTRFHRVNPESCAHCIESDTILTRGIAAGEVKVYRCKNGLRDVATPILVGGEHVGNLFTGQFFFADEKIDYARFREQAHKYGFDENEYMIALEAVPRLTREQLSTGMRFLMKLSNMVSQMSFNNIELARNVTERQRLAEQTMRQAEVLRAVNEIFHQALAADTELEVARGCLGVAELLTSSEFGFLGEVGEDGSVTDLALSGQGMEACAVSDATGHGGLAADLLVHGLFGKVLSEGASFFTNDPRGSSDSVGTPDGHPPLTAFLGAPLVSEGRVVGVIALANRDEGYTEEQRSALDAITPAIVEALERKRAEDALRESRRRADQLALMLESASQPFATASSTGELLDFNPAYENLTGYSREELCALSWRTDLTPPEWQETDAWSLREQKASGWRPISYEKEYVRKDGSRVPVQVIRNVHRDERGEVEYFYAFFTDLTERKRNEAALARTAERLALLADSARLLLTAEEPEKVVRTIADRVMEFLGCDAFFNYVVEDAEGMRLNAYAGVPPEEAERIARLDFGVAVCGCVGRDGEGIVAEDIQNSDDGRTDLVRSYGIQAYACHPLLYLGTPIGTLSFGCRERAAFEDEELELMRVVADQAATAMARKRAEEGLRVSREEIAKLYERERTIADTLQEAIMTPLPGIDRLESAYLYRPASSTANVGGDFYDLFELDEGKVAIVVGDVSGKGLDAARLTSLLRNGIRAYALETSNPARVLERVNELVRRSSDVDAFATVFLGVLDLESGWLRYTSAGHPPAVVCCGSEAAFLPPTPATIVGAFTGAKYGFGEAQIKPAQFLVLYTDGVVEARRDSELFGEERLLEAILEVSDQAVDTMPQGIVDKAVEFAGGRLRDDTVVMVVRWTGPAESGHS